MKIVIDMPERNIKELDNNYLSEDCKRNFRMAMKNRETFVESNDCVSREQAMAIIYKIKENYTSDRENHPINYGTLCDINLQLINLPSVIPTRNKGKWLGDKAYPICSKCNCNIIEEYISCSDYAEMYKPMKFCPNCGAEMEEV